MNNLGLSGKAATFLTGATFDRVPSGGRSQVFHAKRSGDTIGFAVKLASKELASPGARDEAVALIHAEAARLAWAQEHLPAHGLGLPEVVVAPEVDDPDPVVVTTWLDGTVDPSLMRSPEAAVQAFARALASLHEASRRVDLTACPFDASLEGRLTEARARVEAGLVDTTSAVDPFDRYTAAALLERVDAMASAAAQPSAHDVVFLHGDLCVSNVVFDPVYSTVVGALDFSHAGVGDRHLDLAVTARSLARNFSGEVLPSFFAAYGLDDPDLLRIETYAALEELF